MYIVVIIFAIPFIAAILHDFYLNNFIEKERLQEILALEFKPEDFKFTDLGWVIERYTPSVIETLRPMFSDDTWQAWILPVLKEPTIFMTAIPFGIAFTIWLVIFGVKKLQLLAKGGFSKKKDFEVYDYNKKESLKYKRK